jgi:hypothetical protein
VSSTSKVLGVGKIILNMTSEIFLTLDNMLHVDDIKINLMFGLLLSKNDLKLVFESDKFVFLEIKY